MTPSKRPKKSFRIGVARKGVVRPIATVAISPDAGVMVFPVETGGTGWNYGLSADPRFEAETSFLFTPDRPKLHYHRSGIAAVTPNDGSADLVRKRLTLAPVHSVARGQILSVVAVKPWAFPVAEGIRKGDMVSVHRSWPQEVGFSFSLLHFTGAMPDLPPELDDIAPFGLLPGDDSRFTIDISFYVERTLLIGQVKSSPTTGHFEPSVSVAALPWSASGPAEQVLALWSGGARNPIVRYDMPIDVLTELQFRERMATGVVEQGSMDDHVDRLMERGFLDF